MIPQIVNLDILDCTKVCRSMPISVTGGGDRAASNPQNFPSITFHFQPWVSKSVEKELYDILSLFAEIGGYVGIIVGYSILNLADYMFGLVNK